MEGNVADLYHALNLCSLDLWDAARFIEALGRSTPKA